MTQYRLKWLLVWTAILASSLTGNAQERFSGKVEFEGSESNAGSQPQFDIDEKDVLQIPMPIRIDPDVARERPPVSVEFDRVNPSRVVDRISKEMTDSSAREERHLSKIRSGLQVLQKTNESLRRKDADHERTLEVERQRAERAEKLAADAKRSAERSHSITLEAMRRMAQMHQAQLQQLQMNKEQQIRSQLDGNPEQQPAAPGELVPITPVPLDDAAAPPADGTSPGPMEGTAEPERTPPTQPMTEQAVDKIALADSLFGAKEYSSALHVYLELRKDPPEDGDPTWYDYQIACCSRNLNDLDAAEKYYRRVVADRQSFLAPTARWWLQMIADKREALKQLDTLKSVIAQGQNNE